MDNGNAPERWQRWLRRHWVQLVAVVIWGSIALFTRQYLQSQQLTFEELAIHFRSVLQDNWYGPLLYVIAYLIRPFVLIPSSILTLLAGNIFGIGPGFLVALLAGILSALPAYAIGRWFSTGQPSNASSNTVLQRFVGLLRHHPFQAVLLIRLLYLPYDPVNLLAGYMCIPLSTFVMATTLGNVPTTLAYISLGASVDGNPATGQVSFNPYALALSAALIIVSLGISWFYNKRHKTSGQSHSTGAQ